MKIKVAGVFWTVRLLSAEEFSKVHGEKFKDAAAITDTGKKIVDFRREDLNDIHVRHELFHMYFDSLLLDSADLNTLQVEEVTASLLGKYGEEYIKISRKIYRWLVKQNS